MASRDVRPLPSSLRPALLLLAGLGALAALLLGSSGTASAEHAFPAPVVTLTTASVGTGDPAPTWGFTRDASATSATCVLSRGETVVHTLTSCVSPYVAPALAAGDGTYSLVVTAHYPAVEPGVDDPASGHEGGSASSLPVPYLLDTVRPVVGVTGPQAAVYTGWEVTLADDTGSAVTLTCTWSGPAPVPGSGQTCTPGLQQPDLPAEGGYTLTVTAADAAGNTAVPQTSAVFDHDSTPPAVSFSRQPAGTSNDTGPVWEYVVAGGPAPVCTLTGPAGAATVDCSAIGYTATLTASGPYTLTVASTDAAGNTGSATSGTYTLDITGPTVGISPSGDTTGTAESISWSVSTGDAVSGTCVLSNGTSSTCSTGSTITATLLQDGRITLTVTAEDSLGNETTATASYTRDTTPGAPTVLVDPARWTDPDVTWTFSVGARTTSVQCRLDGPGGLGTPEECTSFDGVGGTYTASLPTDGVWTLTVLARNGTSPATVAGSADYDLDRAEPDAPVVTRSPTAASGSTPQITWSWDVDPDHMTRCRLSVKGVDGSWATCNGSFTTTATVEGDHTLQVQYVDDLGNTGTISSSTYTYDTSAPATPTVTLVGEQIRQPGPVTWTWTTVDAARSECRVIGPGVLASTVDWGACTMPVSLTGDGVHRFEVRHYDVAGNPSLAGFSTVTLDGTAPSAPQVSAPGGRTNVSPLTWTLTQTGDDGVGFRCRLVVNGVVPDAFTACASNYPATAQGTYRLDVVAVDAAGNLSSITQGPTWTYDSLGPAAPTVTLATSSGKTPSATWGVATDADVVRYECRLTRTSGGTTSDVFGWTTCTAFTFALDQGDGLYVLHVRGFDDLGNEGAAAAGPGYTLDATAPGTPVVEGSRDGTTGSARDVTYTYFGEGTARCYLYRNGALVTPAGAVCGSTSYTVTLPLDSGTYHLEVTFTDAFDNTSAAGVSGEYVLDVTPPARPTVVGSRDGQTDNELAVTYAYAGESGSSPTCRLFHNGTLVTPGGAVCGTTSYTVTLPSVSGTYRLEVTFTDAYGNTSPAGVSGDYVLDVTPPGRPTVVGSRDGQTDNERAVSYSYEGEGLATCRLLLDGVLVTPAGAQCTATTYTATLPLTDGTYRLEVTFTDAVGNVSAAGVSGDYVLDVTAPEVPVVEGNRDGQTDNERAVSYSYEGEGLATCRLLLDGVLVTPAGAQCTATTYTATLPLTDGTYRLEVTFTDAVGNVSAAGVSGDYVLDVTPPTRPTVVGSRDGQTDNELVVSYAYEGEGTATCRLYRGPTLVTPADATCSATTYTATLPSSSGTYRLEVTFTDAVGNVSVAGVSGSYVLDVTPPGPATVTVTPRTDNVESATWTVTLPEAGTTSECRLLYAGDVVLDWDTCAAGYTYALTEGDGEYVLEVRVTDAVGNLGPVAVGQSYVVDMTPPLEPVVTSNRTVQDNERSVTYAFSGEGVATCQLVRDGDAVGAPVRGCTTGYTITLPNVSGTYVLLVTYEDAVGNVSDPGASPAYELDVTPPAVPVVTSDRSGTDNERVVTYEFDGEGQAMCQLTRDGAPVGAAVECTSPWVVTLPTTDGSYVLLVTYTDAVGNTSAAGASPSYALDLTPPPAPVVLGPPPNGNTRAVTWTYSGEGTASCQLLLDGNAYGAETACGATSFSTTLPSDGAWNLRVWFTDAVGNRGPPGTSAAYLLDTVAPVAPGVAGPTGPAQGRSPSWTVTAEAGTTVECRLLRAGSVVRDWTACSGSYGADLTGLPDGGYVVEARATDKAGNLGAVGSSVAYVLDTTAPLAPTVTGPSGPSQSRSPSFSWTGEPGTTAQCLLSRDGVTVGGWTACSSGFAPVLDRDGTWTLTVRLTDVAGNVGASAASGGYVLDTTPPPAPFVTPPQSPGRDLAPSWGAVVEGGTTLECRLTGPDGTSSGWAACTLPYGTPLAGRPDGAYVLEIRATDAAGNLSPVGSGRYVLDTVAPAAAVVTSPSSPGRSRTPSFGFTSEPGSTTRCRLTSGTTLISDFAPCTSPALVDLNGLPDGTYTLTVRVFDAAGNPGPAATGTYVLDTTGPDAPVATLTPGSPSADRTPTWAFAAEPGSTLVCRLTAPGGAVRDISPCTSPLTVDLTGLPTGTYTLTVRAVDAAGNVGAVLTLTHVLDPAAVAGPDVVGPVSPGSSRTPRWTISTATTTECRLTSGTTVLRDWAVCTGSFTADLFGKPDGTYVLSVRTRTATGTTSAPTTSRYVLDTTAPAAATVVAPPTPSTNRRPTWSIASPELGATAECKVLLFGSVLRDWAPCAVSPAGSLFSDLDLTGRGDGTYTLVVRLTDAAGNRGPETSSAYVLDTSAPVGVGVTGPPSPGKDVTPTWTFSSPASVQLECRLTSVDGVVSDWDPCAGSFTADLTGLPSGTYTLAVRAVSAAGTPGPETTSAYVLSIEAPDRPTALALSGTNATGNDRSPTWTFTLPTGTTGRCVVVQGARTVFDGTCVSPFTLDLSAAQDGSYTLTVTAIDAAGNESMGVSSTYVLDIVPPTAPVFTQVPGGPGSTLDPQWRFTLVHGATAECRLLLDGAPVGDWAACTSPYTAILTGRPDGRYVLEVRAVDAAGNSSAPRANAYVLDRTALPVVTFTRAPKTPDTERDVAWSLSAPQGSGLECRLVAPDATSAWSACAGGYRLDLAGRPDGDYVLEVRVVVDGRKGSISRATYTLDTTPPAAPAFSSGPPPAGSDPQPRWSWNATSDDLVECRLVRVGGGATAWEPCTSPYEAQLTADGRYVLEIRVVDAAGNRSPVTSRAYEYDTRAPAAPVMTSRPPASGSDRTVSWTFDVPQGTIATCTVTRGLSRVDERTCNGRYDLDLTDLPDGVYTLTVRFTDAAGNASNPTASRYTLTSLGTGRPRVDPPTEPTGPPSTGGSTPPAPTGPGRGGTGAGGTDVPQGSTSRPPVPNIPTDTDVPRPVDRPSAFPPSRGAAEEVAAPRPEPEQPRARNPLIPDPLLVRDVPEFVREAVTSTITKPTVPLALLAIVILFLLAQNRIDRRDPKLASAPVEAEPELDFTTIVRRPGGAFS